MDIGIIIICILNLIIGMLIFLLISKNKDNTKDLTKTLSGLEFNLMRLEQLLQDEMRKNRSEGKTDTRELREEVANTLNRFNEAVVSRVSENSINQLAQLDSFIKQLNSLTQMNENKFDQLRESVEKQLKALQVDNNTKLEEMRKTVDEKLHNTLEKRLGESFRLVSERLEQVHKGLGEMQTLATGVGDLKRVLSNVKTRGIWGEIQLGNLLEQILTPEQYEKNVATVPRSNERVEFAIKLPGRSETQESIWLPIDAKFPLEDYQRLLEAQEQADIAMVEQCAKNLEVRIKAEAKDIMTKYISVPSTTEFAILFLPIESLYAEVLRIPSLCEFLMNKYKVVITGPTTLAALLNSLQMGFRTIAIEKRSSEVWSILGAVKTEFSKFGDLLDKTHKKLQEASNSINTAAQKSRTIERKLKNVEQLPQSEAVNLLDIDNYEENSTE
ncbi:MAG: RmuC-domain protein [Firmicutes bacterium]|nr:RmuC-domain protein [Bacillota bacterium]